VIDRARDNRVIQKALARGLVTESQVHDAMKKQKELAEKGQPRPIADILTEDGIIKPDLARALDDRSLEGHALGGFELLAKIGEGGMGAVFKARQTSLGRMVAVKVLDPLLALRSDVAARFKREARAAARLDHPHVVQPIDCGEDLNFLYFAMELMEGGSAAQRLYKEGPFDEREALTIVRSMALALDYAQSFGLVHRDIKPGNILFTRHGAPKLADLGLVMERDDPSQITRTGLTIGTPAYMSPEQALGERTLDVRSDLYALGISLFEILTGKLPFQGPTVAAVLTQHVAGNLPDPRTFRADLSEGTAQLIVKLSARWREERFQSAREVVAAVDSILPRLQQPPPSRDAPTEVEPFDFAASMGSAGGPGTGPGGSSMGASGRRSSRSSLGPGTAGVPGSAHAPSLEGGPARSRSEAGTAAPAFPASPPLGTPSTPGAPPPYSPPWGVTPHSAKPTDDTTRVTPLPPESAIGGPPRGAPRTPRPSLSPFPPPSSGGGRVVAIAFLLVLAAGAGLGYAFRDRLGLGGNGPGAGGPAAAPDVPLDAAAEAKTIRDLEQLLFGKRSRDGAYSDAWERSADPWGTSIALAGLVLDGERIGDVPPPHLELLVQKLRESAFRAPAGNCTGWTWPKPGDILGWPYNIDLNDNTACLEATASVAVAFALAHGRIDGVDLRDDLRGVRTYLLKVQNEDGSWASIPVCGPDGAMIGATADGLHALTLVTKALGDKDPASLRAMASAIGWLASKYSRSRHLWFANPRLQWSNRKRIEGLTERTLLNLLDGKSFLEECGVVVPPEADAVVRDFAEAHAPDDPSQWQDGWGTVGRAAETDYQFKRPEACASDMNDDRWLWWPWRLLVATALANEPGVPRAEDWAREARRLHRGMPAVHTALTAGADPWMVGEAILAANVVRTAARPGGKAVSLVDLVKGP